MANPDADAAYGLPSGDRAFGPRTLTVSIVGAAAIALAAALASRHLGPVALGVLLFAVLSVLGAGAWTWQRWRSRGHPANQLRRELDQSRRDYERLFAAVPCFICVQDRNHHILEANSLYRKEFGVEYGSRCWEVCKKRHTQCPNCIVDQTFADGRVHTSEEVLVTRDGRRINAVVHTRPVLDDAGSISAVMEVFTDITEVKLSNASSR